MADFESNFKYDSDFSKVTDDIKALVREATNANSVFAQLNKTAASVKMEAARSFSAQAGFAGFKAQIVDLTGSTEKFGEQLMKNKLTMKEYFSEAAKAYKKDSKARALAEREVRRAQSAVVGLGDINGKRKGILVTPQSLDMSKAGVQLKIASKQYEIFNDLVQKGSTAMVNWGKNTQWAGRQLTVGLTVPMSIFATKAIQAFAEVDKEITRFTKVYGSDLTNAVGDSTAEMLTQIRSMGSEFAKQYGIASKETVALAADLASAGFEGQKLLTAVNQTTRMMVLGEVDRQSAMQATLSLQTAFNQNSRELAQSIDYLNQVENQTSASLADLTEAIPKAGPVIQALGGDVKDLSVLMTAMREGGISAGEGANALKSGMASLISPTNKAIEVAKQFGLDLQGIVQRNKGQLMPMLLDFQSQLKGLDDFGRTQVIEQIFGKYQLARISALFSNLNAEGSQTVGMIKLMKTSADELAKKSYSELKAQERAPSTRLAAAQQQLQENLIRVGADLAETLLPIMQGALDILQKIVDGFNNLPGPIKNFAKIIGGITAAAGPILMLGGIFGNLIGNAIKFGMSIVNLFKRMTGHPVKQLQILTDEELAAKLAANQLTGAYDRQRTSVMELNAALDIYIANLKLAATIAPPGAVRPGGGMPPVRRADGGVIFAQNGVDSGGRINGYGGGDTVPALLEPGEFVINKQSSSKYAPLLRTINQGGDVPGYSRGKTDGEYKAPKGQYNNKFMVDAGRMPGADQWMKSSATSFPSLIKELENLIEKSPIKSETTKRIFDELSRQAADAVANSSKTSAKAHLIEAISIVEKTLTPAEKEALDVSHDKITVERKQFGFTQRAEQSAYNNIIETLGRANAREVIGNSGVSNATEVLNILGRKESPIEPREVKILDGFFRELNANPQLRTDLNIIEGEFNGKQLESALKFSERMNEIVLSDEAQMAKDAAAGRQVRGYDAYRVKLADQIVAGQLGVLSEEGIQKLTGVSAGRGDLAAKSRQIEKLHEVAMEILKPLESLTEHSTELQRKEAKVLVADRIAAVSELVTGKALATPPELERLRQEIATGQHFRAKAFYTDAPIKIGGEGTIEKQRTAEEALRKAGINAEEPFWKEMAKRFGRKNGGLISKFAGGGLIGGLHQIMSMSEAKALPHATEMLQKGFKVDSLKGTELAALRKKQIGLTHDTKMYRGTRYNWDAAEVGQTIRLPGSQSWSTREDVADTFRAMNEFGGEKRYSAISNQRLEAAGIDPKTFGMSDTYGMFRIPTNTQEALLGTRLDRIQAVERYRKGVSEVKALEAEKKALIESPYPSQESTLFGLTEPAAFEVANRKRQLEELDRKIRGSKVLGKEQGVLDSRAARAKARDINDSPVIFEMVTPKGTQTLPLSDITGRGRSIKGMGAMDEFEHLITDGTMRIVKKYIDERGVKRIVGEFVDAKKFAFGGRVGKWNMPFSSKDPAMSAIKDWTGGEMGQFRNTAIHPILRGQKAVGYRRGLNPNFNKDKLYKILNSLGIIPEGIVMRRASTLNPGVSTEFADSQQLKLMEAIRSGKFDEVFGMELNQKGLSSYTSLDPRTGATGFTGIDRFHMREEPMAWKKDLRSGTGRIERGTGNTYAGPKGFEQVYFEHRTSGVERGRDISANKVYGGQTTLDEVLTYKMNSIIDAVSTDLKTRKTIFHTKGIPGYADGGQLPGYGGGDKVPALLEPGEFVINKQASAQYAPILKGINDGTVGKFAGGRVSAAMKAGGGGMGVAMQTGFGVMSLVALPGIINDIRESGLNFTNGLELAMNALFLSMSAKTFMDMGKAFMGFTAATEAATGATAAAGSGLMAALAPLAVPLGIVAAGLVVVGTGLYLWRRAIDANADSVKNLYSEANEMAKVYNIELRKNTQALKENRRQLLSAGLLAAPVGRGQTDKDYAAAVKKQFGSDNGMQGNVIDRISGESKDLRRRDMATVYSSLLLQGFSSKESSEILGEIARQANASSDYAQVIGVLTAEIKNEDDAMSAIVDQYGKLNSLVATAEEKTSAFTGTYQSLVRMSAENPTQFAAQVDALVKTLYDTTDDMQTVKDTLLQNLSDMGYADSAAYKKISQMTKSELQDNQDWVQEAIKGAQHGFDDAFFSLEIDEMSFRNAQATMVEQLKQSINEQADIQIGITKKQIKNANDYYDGLIAKEEAAKAAAQDAHDKKMKNLEDEGKKLGDLKDIIQNNSDFYIMMLEKEYKAEQYFQQQRESSLGGLKSLAEGNIFGFLDSQMKAASESQQFGREQAIQAIEDTTKEALAGIDAKLKANQEKMNGLDDATNGILAAADDRIASLNTERSALVKALNDYIDSWTEIKNTDVGAITAQQLEDVQTTAKNLKISLPKDMEDAFGGAADKILSSIGNGLDNAITTLMANGDITSDQAAKLLAYAMGEINATAGQTGAFDLGNGTDQTNTSSYGGNTNTIYNPKGADKYRKQKNAQGNYDVLVWDNAKQKYVPMMQAGPNGKNVQKTFNAASGLSVNGVNYSASDIASYDTSAIPTTGVIQGQGTSGKTQTSKQALIQKLFKAHPPVYKRQYMGLGRGSTIYKRDPKTGKYNQFVIDRMPDGEVFRPAENKKIAYKVVDIQEFNSGGVVGGYGNTDTIPAMLTPGEFVMNKSAAAQNMPALQAMNAGFKPSGFARGGGYGIPKFRMPSNTTSSSANLALDTTTNNTSAVSNSTNNNITMPVNIVVNGSNLSSSDIINVVGQEMNKQRRAIERYMGI